MFKLHRHRSDRLGERVDFRFSSFQAFQIPRGWDKLVLSLVSKETGKTIAKSNKAMVRSGTCQWTETFSESIWILQRGASKVIEDCVFKLVVSMGSHRSGILGELMINLTDYMSSNDSGSLSLPLQKCNYGTLVQVRIQCLNPKGEFSDGRSSKEASYIEKSHMDNANLDRKSNGSDNMLNRILESSSSNNSGVTYPDEPVNRDTSFSASGSHRSSDSGDSAIGKLNSSPRNKLNGASYVRRQDSADDYSRSNPSSFNSRASGSSTPVRWHEAHGVPPISLRPSSSKDFLEAAEETIEELQDEAKMWERHAQKLKLDIEKYKKEISDRSKRQAELDVELSAACSERDSLKQEIEQLKLSLEEATTKQAATRASKSEVMVYVQKELEDEVKFLKESNYSLSIQLKKSQEANIELVSILEELEETVEKQRVELANVPKQSPVSECEGEMWSQKVLDVEAKWGAKLSAKEEEIKMLQEKLSGMLNAECPSDKESSHYHLDLVKEIEILRVKVQELESDCTELTDENLELMFKLKKSGKGIDEKEDSKNSDSEVDFFKSQVHRLEEELRMNEMMNGGMTEPSAIHIKSLEKRCADLEVELQYFKDHACHLDTKLRESQMEVEGKISELSELQKNLQAFNSTTCKQCVEKGSDIEELKSALFLKEEEIGILQNAKEELEVLLTSIQRDKSQLEEDLTSVLRESSIISKQQAEIDAQKGELEQKLIDAQERMSETQQEIGYLKRSNSKLQSTVESHIEENNSLHKSNGELRKQILELHEHNLHLEVELSELREKTTEFLRKVESLELKLSSVQYEIISRENILTSQLDSILQEHEDREEEISGAKLMLNQIEAEKTIEIENLKREVAHLSSQLCVTQDERQRMASDAVLEVSNLRSDKIKLESSLQDAHSKIKQRESELQSLRQESGKKVQGLVDLLNASKQAEQRLMSEIEDMQRQTQTANSSEAKFKRVASELELKLKASEFDKQQILEETSSLKVQAQKIAHLQDEIFFLKSSLEEAKSEKGKLEEQLQSVSEQCEGWKTERLSFMEKISDAQKSLQDGEDDRRGRIALEEKLHRLEEDLSAKEVLYVHEARLKDEINRMKAASSEVQRKIQCLEEEKCELLSKVQVQEEENQDKIVLDKDDGKLHDLEARIQDLEAKICMLEKELAESVESNNMYRIQLQGFTAEKQGNDGEIPRQNVSENNIGSQHSTKIASLETELKEMRERYLNMSLQYAEVEAQREQLVMKLKTTGKGKGWFA